MGPWLEWNEMEWKERDSAVYELVVRTPAEDNKVASQSIRRRQLRRVEHDLSHT